jgi:hypothetical protein
LALAALCILLLIPLGACLLCGTLSTRAFALAALTALATLGAALLALLITLLSTTTSVTLCHNQMIYLKSNALKECHNNL